MPKKPAKQIKEIDDAIASARRALMRTLGGSDEPANAQRTLRLVKRKKSSKAKWK